MHPIINTKPPCSRDLGKRGPGRSLFFVSGRGKKRIGRRLGIDLDGIAVIVGNYGSGKSEVSINLAIDRKRAGLEVQIADLDLVNPYFRTREVRDLLSGMGIRVVLPPAPLLQADLPILSPAVAGMIRNPGDVAILDVGGDDVGATVLAALGDSFKANRDGSTPLHVIQVVNRFRPFTETVSGCDKIRQEIEQAAGIEITGWIGNTNLMEETNSEHIYQGYAFCRDLAAATGIPLLSITVPSSIQGSVDMNRFDCPVLVIERRLTTPWTRKKRH